MRRRLSEGSAHLLAGGNASICPAGLSARGLAQVAPAEKWGGRGLLDVPQPWWPVPAQVSAWVSLCRELPGIALGPPACSSGGLPRLLLPPGEPGSQPGPALPPPLYLVVMVTPFWFPSLAVVCPAHLSLGAHCQAWYGQAMAIPSTVRPSPYPAQSGRRSAHHRSAQAVE